MVNNKKIFSKLNISEVVFKRTIGLLILSSFIFNPLSQLDACTTFFLRNGDHIVCGRNFDFSFDDYFISVNRRNFTKTAFSYPNEMVDLPATWTSKYGSITFNLGGHDAPTDGMNEVGLIVTSLVLVETVYPTIGGAPSVSLDQWIQYLLDNYATVEEVIAACSQINIRYQPEDNVRLHFFVTDNTGKNAVLEFIDGQIVATAGTDLEKNAIANSSYQLSIDYFKQGGDPNLPATASLNRYYNAVQMVDAYNNQDIVDYSYSIMDAVAQRHTQRKIIYDITNMRVYLKTRVNEQLRFFDFSTFDFSCQAQPLVYLEASSDIGDIRSQFVPYTAEINRNLAELSWTFFEKNYTQGELDEFAQYPSTFECDGINTGSVVEDYENFSFSIYPNPFKEYLNLKYSFPDIKQIEVRVFTTSGRLVFSNSFQHQMGESLEKIDMSSFAKGNYIIMLKSGKLERALKLIKH